MNEHSINKLDSIGEQLNAILKKKGLKPQHLIDAGKNSNQVYSVLRRGNPSRVDYRISSLVDILVLLNLELTIEEKE
ncbi:hypothetical protein JJC03_09100 [Flavobacterium oreochromis]|uniref:hypothetical protein n=1 Tax=Flavobacterium oreochromis TaxID=2906078 RepID=UPI001CE4D7DA|nr:hypothetical protein [Flavobacterium oreochromis]QYS85395.1 hypothetical protein JJC03_09100 [Flavobacterium oreochromis]